MNSFRTGFSTIFFVLLFGGLQCAWSQEVDEENSPDSFNEPSEPRPPTRVVESGYASFYHGVFHGRRTASGEIFNRNGYTAAHKTLPFGTLARVTNLRNDRSVVVRINDRGPLIKNRIIDISPRAARELGILDRGVAWVKLEVMNGSEASEFETR